MYLKKVDAFIQKIFSFKRFLSPIWFKNVQRLHKIAFKNVKRLHIFLIGRRREIADFRMNQFLKLPMFAWFFVFFVRKKFIRPFLVRSFLSVWRFFRLTDLKFSFLTPSFCFSNSIDYSQTDSFDNWCIFSLWTTKNTKFKMKRCFFV